MFLSLAATAPLAGAPPAGDPVYKVVTHFKHEGNLGMPGPYPGKVVRVHAENSIDPAKAAVNRDLVRQMIATSIKELTGDATDDAAWARFITPKDIVGIKVNCSGAPRICSTPEIVGAIADKVVAAGVPARNIYVYERFESQLVTVPYAKFLPQGVNIVAAESNRGSILGYDPNTYIETSFFGEDDTRSNLIRLVAEKLTKIVNVPVMKEHQAAGVTGCLKNIAYGNFSNMDRSHRYEQTNTRTFIGTLASTEPVKSRVVLNIMDGLHGVWHAGPFSNYERFRFYPKEILVGTDPVAMDHKLIDIIEAKRESEHAVSLFNRDRAHLGDNRDPNFNRFIREPGHVEYASTLGLGVFDQSKITMKSLEL